MPQAIKNRPCDDALTDVELFDGFDFDDGSDVVIVEPMSGGDMQTHFGGIDTQAAERFEFLTELLSEFSAAQFQLWDRVVGLGKVAVKHGVEVGVVAGMEFDPLGAELVCGCDRIMGGINEKRDVDLLLMESGDGVGEGRLISSDGEASFRGDLFTLFRDDGGTGRTKMTDDVDDLGSNGTFEVDRQRGVPDNGGGILIVHVAAIFAQVDGDLIGAGSGADAQRLQGIGIVDAAGFAQDGNVVDVDSKMHKKPFEKSGFNVGCASIALAFANASAHCVGECSFVAIEAHPTLVIHSKLTRANEVDYSNIMVKSPNLLQVIL